ncbi:hypothetical protein Vadar_014400 [Vaccinium darrowii]|uniref:Uncharacterized protein n=1 Tax=Vaccinium darrowii TaxID=229202 RepID=A0ACB7X9P3_9ERIC|nr:hypothetical protein Vadar_014400 [Vaccinium darrowii]
MDSGTWDGSVAATDDNESLSSTNDAELLKRAWRIEKAAPEILQFEAGLEEIVEELMASGNDPLTVSLNQMDMDRTLFLLRSYLRTRLQKIEKYMVHIHKNTELWYRLSKEEQKFAKRCIEDLEEHFEKSVLSKLPDRYKSSVKQSVISEEDDMVQMHHASAGAVTILYRYSGIEDPVDLDPGDLYAVRYKSIKSLVYSGRVELV